MKRIHSLIIGGTRGIGRSLVKELSADNHMVSVVGRRAPSGLDQQLENTVFFTVDLIETETVNATLSEILRNHGRLNNLIFFQRFRDDGDNWQGEINISLTATKNVIEYLADHFTETSENSITIVNSLASHFIADEQPLSYHVAKAGLYQMVRYYAVTFGEKGIRVNSVSPGTVLKDETKDFYMKENQELYNLYKDIIPLGRMGTPQETANAIMFLCSRHASFITGQDIVVDGGLSLLLQSSLARNISLL